MTHLPPSEFIVRPDIADPLCNGGRGIRLSIPSWEEKLYTEERTATVATSTGTVAGGSTMIAFSGFQGKGLAVLHLLTPRCEPDRQFGVDDTATISVPSSLRLPHPSVPGFRFRDGLWIDAVAERNGGGAVVAGNYEGQWVVGEVTRHGTLDTAFGDDGWASLPIPGGADAILQEPSGRIIVAGGNDGGGCCTRNWAAAVSTHGELEDDFGAHGRVELPTGESSAVDSLDLLPNGDILAQVSYAHMGCAGHPLAALTPSGQPEPMFATRLARFWGANGFEAFVGYAYVDANGFTLVGTGQKGCTMGFPSSELSATGLIARFRADGEPADPTTRFPTRMYGYLWVFPNGHDSVILASSWADKIGPSLTALQPNGSADPRFGSRGWVQIRCPSMEGGRGVEALTNVSVTKGAPGEITLVAEVEHDLVTVKPSERDELQLIRLRL